MVEALQADEFAQREAATTALVALGPGVIQPTRNELARQTDPEIRERLRSVLERFLHPCPALAQLTQRGAAAATAPFKIRIEGLIRIDEQVIFNPVVGGK